MRRVRELLGRNLPVVLLVAVFLLFSALEPRFLDVATVGTVLRNSAYIGIVAVGMTLVLLTAGIDLSVGSILYLCAVVVGDIVRAVDVPVIALPIGMVLVGLLAGAVNGVAVTVLRIIPFIVTLATLTLYRGLGFSVSSSAEVNFPTAVTDLGRADVVGIPLPVLVFGLVVLVAHLLVVRTQFGRQLVAVGEDRRAAERAGLPVRRILLAVYAISGALAGLAAFVAMTQLRTAAPGFGQADEFDAIAAAVLGGTSLFGGRGSVFPGTVAGVLLIKLIDVGLVFLDVDLYVTPMVSAAIVLLAVLLDSLRTGRLDRLKRRIVTSEREQELIPE